MNSVSFSIQGRTALVTGASSGIGHGVAKGLAAAGAAVVVAARRTDRLEALVADIEAGGGRAMAITMDVTDRASVDAAFDEIGKMLSVADVIINNAGVADPANFLKADEASRDLIMNTNFSGVWNVAQEGARRLVAAGRSGSIVNIASVLGMVAQTGQASYGASKSAVIHLTSMLSLELMRYKIRVNAIAPGWLKTEMNEEYFDSPAGKAFIEQMPAKRLGNIEELIGPVLLLASDAGSFINGAVLPVDGAFRHRG